MTRPAVRNILIFSAIGIAYFIVLLLLARHDARSIAVWDRNKYTMDSVHITYDERRIARRFADSTLPGLRRIGLITDYHESPAGIFVYVSRRVWKDRTPFFEKSFLTELTIYNKVSFHSLPAKVVDDSSGELIAEVPASHTIRSY